MIKQLSPGLEGEMMSLAAGTGAALVWPCWAADRAPCVWASVLPLCSGTPRAGPALRDRGKELLSGLVQ